MAQNVQTGTMPTSAQINPYSFSKCAMAPGKGGDGSMNVQEGSKQDDDKISQYSASRVISKVGSGKIK